MPRDQTPSAMSLQIDAAALRPMVADIVAEVIARLEANRAQIEDGRIAWTEAEAAPLIGLQAHQLRDERRRGRIAASIGPGRKILYARADLIAYLAARRWTANGD